MLYGFLIRDMAVFFANLITFALAMAVITLTVKERLSLAKKVVHQV